MKKVLVSGIITATIIAVAGVIFYACKKDPAEIANKTRVMGNVSGDELREFENYTPSETIIEEKLMMINNCVNDPDANPMLDMELKEAVWFLEAYFNIGVCQKQEYPCKYVDKEMTYSIEIPHANGWEEGEDVFLDGQQLQSAYRTLLQNIVADVCFEYAINFGDVFVQAVNEDVVTLGLEICYGPRDEIGEDMPNPPPPGSTLKIVSPTFSPVHYPGNQNDTYTYNISDLAVVSDKAASTCVEYVQEKGMSLTLNQERTWLIPTGTQDAPCNTAFSNTEPYATGQLYCVKDVVNGQVTLTVADLNHWGSIYRKYIYDDLPVSFDHWKNLPDNANFLHHEFLWAKCAISNRQEHKDEQAINNPVGIMQICRFIHPEVWMLGCKFVGF